MNQGIIFIGLSGIITTYNSSAEKILEVKHKNAIFKNYWDIFPDALFGFSMRSALETFDCPDISYIETREKELEIATSFVCKGSKSNQGIILLIRDITNSRLQNP